MTNDPDLSSQPDTASPRPAGYAGERLAAEARVTDERAGETAVPRHADPVVPQEQLNREARHDVVKRQKESFGGFKFGAAFFGWLAAMGLAVILTALVSAIGAGIGLGANEGDVDAAAQGAAASADTVTLVGAIALAVVLLVSYYAGGYVAGRMARFSGAKQGLAVWIWAVVIAIVVAVVTAIAGAQFNVLGNVDAFPRIPVDEGTLTVTGIVTVVLVAVISLVGAVLGGLAGMHYHRKVDRVGLGR
jgi:hypothetical protein